jgi:hypothetical protein
MLLEENAVNAKRALRADNSGRFLFCFVIRQPVADGFVGFAVQLNFSAVFANAHTKLGRISGAFR